MTRKPITVIVTQVHIDEGRERSCSTCPVALAVRDTLDLGKSEVVHVNLRDILIYEDEKASIDGHEKACYSLPDEANLFINRFDSRVPVMMEKARPFTFRARPSSLMQRCGDTETTP